MSETSSGKAPTPTATQTGTQTVAPPNPALPDAVAEILTSQGVPPGKAHVIVQQITTEVQHRLHAGPLPTVEDFRGYDNVCPGAARDILDMAMRQQRHVHFMEKLGAISDFLMPILALVAAVATIGGMLWGGIYLAMNGHENLAIGVLSGTGIVTVAGAFLQSWMRRSSPSPSPPASQKKSQKKKR
jgi:uncharacterized membrane protein